MTDPPPCRDRARRIKTASSSLSSINSTCIDHLLRSGTREHRRAVNGDAPVVTPLDYMCWDDCVGRKPRKATRQLHDAGLCDGVTRPTEDFSSALLQIERISAEADEIMFEKTMENKEKFGPDCCAVPFAPSKLTWRLRGDSTPGRRNQCREKGGILSMTPSHNFGGWFYMTDRDESEPLKMCNGCSPCFNLNFPLRDDAYPFNRKLSSATAWLCCSSLAE